jgi:hypothetical protein
LLQPPDAGGHTVDAFCSVQLVVQCGPFALKGKQSSLAQSLLAVQGHKRGSLPAAVLHTSAAASMTAAGSKPGVQLHAP